MAGAAILSYSVNRGLAPGVRLVVWGSAVIWRSTSIGMSEGDAVIWGNTGGLTAQNTPWKNLNDGGSTGAASGR